MSENTSDDKKKELSNQLEEDGFLLHKDKGCEYGCNFCREFRRVTSWPDGIPLLKNPAAYQKAVLYQLCHHYNLRLEELPDQGSDNDLECCSKRSQLFAGNDCANAPVKQILAACNACKAMHRGTVDCQCLKDILKHQNPACVSTNLHFCIDKSIFEQESFPISH